MLHGPGGHAADSCGARPVATRAPIGGVFASIHADFRSPTRTACAGTWYFRLNPATLPQANQVVSPLEVGPAQPWIADRYLFEYETTTSGGGCGLPETRAWATCGDRFAVQSIMEIARP
jgi:hypothetical protein